MTEITKLTVIEQTNFERLEMIVEEGLQTFYEVGNALAEIKEKRLYRATHDTFAEYVSQRWNMGKTYAYNLIGASSVVGNLSAIADTIPMPTSESLTRPLAKLEPEQQREVWETAVATAPNGKVTAAHVKETIKQASRPEKTPNEYKAFAKRIVQHTTAHNLPLPTDWTEMLRYSSDIDPERSFSIEEIEIAIKVYLPAVVAPAQPAPIDDEPAPTIAAQMIGIDDLDLVEAVMDKEIEEMLAYTERPRPTDNPLFVKLSEVESAATLLMATFDYHASPAAFSHITQASIHLQNAVDKFKKQLEG